MDGGEASLVRGLSIRYGIDTIEGHIHSGFY